MRSMSAPLFAIVLAGCGDRVAYRPLVVEVQGLSSAAERLVLKVFPASERDSCAGIMLANVQGLETPFVSEWNRGNGERELEVPRVDDDAVTVVVYTEDTGARAIQLACSEVKYEEIESGRISLRLSVRTASIIGEWRRSLDRSRSNGSSDVAGWRRCSSRAGEATASIES